MGPWTAVVVAKKKNSAHHVSFDENEDDDSDLNSGRGQVPAILPDIQFRI